MLAGRWAGVMPGPAGVLVERKWDGFRCLFFPGLDRRPGLWTRNGMPMPGVGHILARLLEVEAAMGGQWMIDGEFVVHGTLAATKAHYERGWRSGNAGTFHAFDAVPLADWQRGHCDMPLVERKATLARAIEATAPDCSAWEWSEGSRGRRMASIRSSWSTIHGRVMRLTLRRPLAPPGGRARGRDGEARRCALCTRKVERLAQAETTGRELKD